MILSKPQTISADHITDNFDCGYDSLNAWLQYRALNNHKKGFSRVFVSVDEYNNVQGYYALAAGEICHADIPKKLRRNAPNPIPVVVLGRLAVNNEAQGQQLGRGLLQDAYLRALQASESIAIRALLVHAINDDAKKFYLQYGFEESPINPLTLLLPVK